ncbi:phosphoglycerate mutase [Streptosporangium sp. 'caverna']|uniref:phosphoglycerate mutase n=1 Tax=Streptosporangium sp. 'caverna' TaxID=2202249 RepID=UPI000D7D974E|nr:phosphoglycerate mutase [Streptosporangium sp. 'caverna']AWS43666.1 phosphoglycerate mutase [Streptosporangium sp. 'caverna']
MKPPGYGENRQRPDDDRLPIILVILDGLGDRPVPELGDRTPSEAAHTPHLDALARRGSNGWHLPFGWGRAPTSELAHWAMFGYSTVPFPGRGVLEALGAGVDVTPHAATVHAALRTSQQDGDRLWITGRASHADNDDADELLTALGPVLASNGIRIQLLGGRGEALLTAPAHTVAAVTDSDPFFETFHPWLRPQPTSDAGKPFALTLTNALYTARKYLVNSPINGRRIACGLSALDVLTTKWAGVHEPVPAFIDQIGVAGAAVTSTRLYRGLATALGMRHMHLRPRADLEKDLNARLAAAEELIGAGARFVHVHTKVTDEAGHTKAPHAKRVVLEAIDRGLARLGDIAEHTIVAVTGDHSTPSTHGLLHAGEPTPLTVVGPTVRRDEVTTFGETPARRGWYGTVPADDLLPLLLGHANRPVLLGHRITPRPVIALADQPQHMRV